jgi:hypothetical protein
MRKHLQIVCTGAIAFAAQVAFGLDVVENRTGPLEMREESSDQNPQKKEPVPTPTSRGPAPKSEQTTTRPSGSAEDNGTLVRVTILEVVPGTSHLVLNPDNTPIRYRFTKDTHFVDEAGRVLSFDAIKSGTNATLFYKRTAEEVVLTKVVVNSSARPLSERRTGFLAEVDLPH